jgi:hypothetical protein
LGVNLRTVSDHIDDVLAGADAGIRKLASKYRHALFAKELPGPLLVTIKSVLEHERSALDYLAWSITEAYGKAGAQTYYPLAYAAEGFDNEMDYRMKGVALAQPKIAAAIGRHQPYEHDALKHLSTLTRHAKHRHLSKHVREERAGSVVVGPGGMFWWYGGGTPLWFVTPGMEPPAAGDVEMTLVDWYFVEPHVPILETLNDIQAVVGSAVRDIRKTTRL